MRNFLAVLLIVLCYSFTLAQNNIGIGTTSPNPNAILDLNNGNQGLGLLLPKVDVLAFTPAPGDFGMFVYDTLQNQIFYWDGADWNGVSPGWTLNGNAGTDPANDFIGTTDAQDLVFRTNNIQRLRISSTGQTAVNASPQTGTPFFVYRDATSFGDSTSTIHGKREGNGTPVNGGIGWSFTEIDAAVKGSSYWGNNFSAGVAGYNYNDFSNSAAVIGVQYLGNYWGALGFKDSLNQEWGLYSSINTYTGGNETVRGNSQIDGLAGIGGSIFSNTVLNVESNYSGASLDYGVYMNSTKNQNAKVGYYAILDSASSGNRLTGVDALLNPIGTNNEAWGLKTYIQPTGTGDRRGVDVTVLSSATSTGPFYGGLFTVQNEAAGASSYGVYIDAFGASPNRYGVFSISEAYNYFSGDVGIGITAAQYPLHVQADDWYGADFGTMTIYGGTGNQSNTIVAIGNNIGTAGNTPIYSETYISGYAPNPTGINNYGVWGHQTGAGVGGYGILATNGASRVTPDRYVALAGATYAGIFSGGNVGIGTTAPFRTLEVSGIGLQAARIISTNFLGATVELIRPGAGGNDFRMFNNATLRFQFDANEFGVSATDIMTIGSTGNVNVIGFLSKGGGSFKIDHPQDPANKFLYHSFVESPDMMNVYNGNITTDGNGEAIIQLPDYFGTLNKDFRYQLTPIGQFAQLIILREVNSSTNTFTIQSDQPNVKVSWQVTGIRKDPWAEANRIQDVVDKKPEEKGYFLHPTLYGQPINKQIGDAPVQEDEHTSHE